MDRTYDYNDGENAVNDDVCLLLRYALSIDGLMRRPAAMLHCNRTNEKNG